VASTAIDTQVHSRPLTAQEEIYWRLTYTDQIHPVLAAEVMGRTDVSQWRAALDSVQRRHPLLQVAIEMPGMDTDIRQPVFVPRPAERIPLRAAQPNSKEATIAAEIQRELATPFVSCVAPLARAVLLHAPEHSVFPVAISHSIADGMSALIFIRDLLTALGGQALEALPMPASAEALLGLRPVSPDIARLDGAEPLKNAGREPSVQLKIMSERATKALIATARARNSTVHAALMAACVSAMRQLVTRFQTEPCGLSRP
jgi:hypothetical protein